VQLPIQGSRPHATARLRLRACRRGHNTRAIQDWLGHRALLAQFGVAGCGLHLSGVLSRSAMTSGCASGRRALRPSAPPTPHDGKYRFPHGYIKARILQRRHLASQIFVAWTDSAASRALIASVGYTRFGLFLRFTQQIPNKEQTNFEQRTNKPTQCLPWRRAAANGH
jgi:hypothetical protein